MWCFLWRSIPSLSCLNSETVFLTTPTQLLLTRVGTVGLFHFDLQRHPWSMELCLSECSELPQSGPGLSSSLSSQWNSLRVRRQSDFFACVVLDVCVSRVGAPQGYSTCSERTKWLGNVLGTTTCFQTVVFSHADLGPLFSFCSGQDGGKVSGWWAWMDALLTDPQAGQLSCKDHTKHWKFCCTIFCLKV